MLVKLDVNARVWLMEHFGKMPSSKQTFLWCEANAPLIMLQPDTYEWIGDVPKPGFLRAKDPKALPLEIDLPEYILRGLAYVLFECPLSQHPADRLTMFMIDALELSTNHEAQI